MEIAVETGGFAEAEEDLLRDAVLRTLQAEGREVVELSLTVLDDEGIRELNRTWLGHDRPTDVIAFGLGEEGDLVGDVYLGFEQARRQATEHGVSVREELARLTVHGTLHVLGHDHPEGEERWDSPMYRRQEEILLGLLGGAQPR